MDNKSRKEKVIKWLLIGIGCAIVLAISRSIDSSFAAHNRMEYMMNGGIAADGASLNLISKSNPLWIAVAFGMVISSLGLILSAFKFLASAVSCWVNNSPVVVQQTTDTDTDTLVQLGKLYKEGLLTKQEFETKKKQLLRGKDE